MKKVVYATEKAVIKNDSKGVPFIDYEAVKNVAICASTKTVNSLIERLNAEKGVHVKSYTATGFQIVYNADVATVIKEAIEKMTFTNESNRQIKLTEEELQGVVIHMVKAMDTACMFKA